MSLDNQTKETQVNPFYSAELVEHIPSSSVWGLSPTTLPI